MISLLEYNQAGPLLIDGEDCVRIDESWKIVTPTFDSAFLRKKGSYVLLSSYIADPYRRQTAHQTQLCS